MTEPVFDVFVIGGGINGVGVARDASGRGLSVGLCEKDDIASHTSSASTKLIHGGLRYLEHYDFMLVRKALKERETLLKAAPHIIWPLRFVIPAGAGGRPSWMIRLGLWIYDHLGGRKQLPATQTVSRQRSNKFESLKDKFSKGYEYSDCWVDDARLCVLNAMDARVRNARILTRTECVSLQRGEKLWTIGLRTSSGDVFKVQAKTLVNAAGPWVEQVANLARHTPENQATVRLVKGSHIVVPKVYDGDHCYFFQNPDGRIFFAIPYVNGSRTLIGTTDVPVDHSEIQNTQISQDEIDYLCESASAYFERPISSGDVSSTYSGVRPLYDDQSEDASKVTRDYVLKYDSSSGPAIVSIFGGKITTYRTLAEQVLQQLEPDLPQMGAAWTCAASLPGGDIEDANFDLFLKGLFRTYHGFSPSFIGRLARLYGTKIYEILGETKSESDLGTHFGAGLYEKEVNYLIEHEFARSADDILFRRTKLGLDMTESQNIELEYWIKENHSLEAAL